MGTATARRANADDDHVIMLANRFIIRFAHLRAALSLEDIAEDVRHRMHEQFTTSISISQLEKTRAVSAIARAFRKFQPGIRTVDAFTHWITAVNEHRKALHPFETIEDTAIQVSNGAIRIQDYLPAH